MWGVVRGGSAVTELAALGRTVRGAWRRGRGAREEDLRVLDVGFQHLRVFPACWLNTRVG